MSKNRVLAVLSLICIIFFWSYGWLVMKSVLSYIEPWTFAAIRCFLGSFTLFIVLVVQKKSLAPPPLFSTFLVGLFQTCGMSGFGQLALVQGGAGNTAIFAYTMPFWLILLSALFLGEKISRIQFSSFVIAGVGFLLVVQPWEKNDILLSTFFATLAGLAWAIGSIIAKHFYQKQPSFDVLNFTAWQILIGAVIISPIAFLLEESPIIYSQELIFSLAYSAILATGVSWTLWLFVLRHLSTSVSGVSMLFVPVLSVIFAWILLDEIPNGAKIIGIIFILLALILTTGATSSIKRKTV